MNDSRDESPRAVPPVPTGFSPERLDGWKEIAAYLRRSVRTVQRWEVHFNLPVHRISTGQNESVYAVRRELDAWLLRTAEARAEQEAQDRMNGSTVEPGALRSEANGEGRPPARAEDAAPPSFPAAHRRRRARWPSPWWFAVAAGVIAFVAFQFGWLRPSYAVSQPVAVAPPPAKPHALAVDGRTLMLLGADGREVAHHVFDDDIVDLRPPEQLSRLAAIADLDLDGRVEVVVAITKPSIQRVFVLNADGTERANWRPSRRVRFGQSASLGPGLVFTTITPASPPDGTFYVAGHVPIEFASVVVHLDVDGRVLHEYWSNGYIESLAQMRVGDSPRWLVGAANNETGGGSLAVFDGPPQGSAPARAEHYRCADCPAGQPMAFYVFPRSRIQTRVGLCASVTAVEPDLSGGALVHVSISGNEPPAVPARAHYFLGPDLRVRRATVGDSFPGIVERLIAARWFGVSPADRYRGQADLFPVLQWNAGRAGFVQLPTPPGP
jgi:hypothetical protein